MAFFRTRSGACTDPRLPKGTAARRTAATLLLGLGLAAATPQAAAGSAGAGWRFTDTTAEAGLAYAAGYLFGIESMNDSIAGGVAAADYDRDGWTDLYVTRGDVGPNLLFRNRGDGTFEETGAAAGVALVGRYSGPVFADFDGDRWPDLFVGAVAPSRPRLLRNRADGTFAEVGAAAGLEIDVDTYSAAFGDYDRDGHLDLVTSHWEAARNARLWRNQGDGTFAEAMSLPTLPSGTIYSFASNFADIDLDGFPDLLVAADFATSQVYRNQGDGTFVRATDATISDENGMGAAVGDYDNDGDLDWFVSSIFDPGGPIGSRGASGNRLYRNRGDGTFDDVTDAAGVRDGAWGWGSCLADFDNDANLDLYHVNGFHTESRYLADRARLFVAKGDGTFDERAVELGTDDPGQGRGVVCFDYDGDGDVDIFVFNNSQPGRLLRNDGGNRHRHLEVRLRGLPPNRAAIGARVYVRAAGRTQMREVRAGSNFESQDPTDPFFGTGRDRRARWVRVVWPDGSETVRRRVATGRTIHVRQKAPAAANAGPSGPRR